MAVISLADAQRVVIDACPPLTPVETAAADAVGRVLADDVAAGEDVPPFANSAVDGYAVIAGDTAAAPVELAVAGELRCRGAAADGAAVPWPDDPHHDRCADAARRRRCGDGRGLRAPRW